MVNPSDKAGSSEMDEMSLLIQANRQAKKFYQFTQLAERIKPQLTYYGVNFNVWLEGLINAWGTYYNEDTNYFEQYQPDQNHLQRLVAISFIKYSIQHHLFESITSNMRILNARTIYQAIRSRSNKPSWSSIIHNAKILFNKSDCMEDINAFLLLIYEAIIAI
ncbi:hypothetical protein O181_016677 [Austropuccinia psidii MF-1]|uniref:Uncharacterized protein n=1 Tax=Austropuccinia psidii MF-1 TaxID=1389203 RepID=A0A9Q3C4H4_9BASI|nr:hypothetical protein [Austropuccinia psidii MF-1]